MRLTLPVEPRITAEATIPSTSQLALGPFCSLVIDQRSTLLPLTDGFRKNIMLSLEAISLSLSIHL